MIREVVDAVYNQVQTLLPDVEWTRIGAIGSAKEQVGYVNVDNVAHGELSNKLRGTKVRIGIYLVVPFAEGTEQRVRIDSLLDNVDTIFNYYKTSEHWQIGRLQTFLKGLEADIKLNNEFKAYVAIISFDVVILE